MNMQINNTPFTISGMAPLIQVFDMPTSLRFYRDVLGFKVAASSGEGDDVDWVLFKLNEIEFMLNTAYEKSDRPATPDSSRTEAHNDTSFYFGCPHTDALYSHLQNNGINADKPAITKYNFKALHVKDPDGYLLCFHWPVQVPDNHSAA
ncbi:VOC family protein [Mucilaginibacter sp. FT3.2]|uniref:VOC family protein n=1 Tax=Mucilaginibacter sp. FT3.2 TaxID=2723090 RepID=UPI00180B0224|nr:VOC family protein [Mucilaginibacter sp. FT3.2]MBB6234885.1 catechol 2,3-dioxygenase-like lactoylglutathione lyase family enzyme [Mucilaginibacter sp. FT3.2]